MLYIVFPKAVYNWFPESEKNELIDLKIDLIVKNDNELCVSFNSKINLVMSFTQYLQTKKYYVLNNP